MARNHVGSIRPRAGTENGWRLRVSLGRDPDTGRFRVSEHSFTGTETQAKKALARMVTDAANGKITADRCTVAALLERYIAHASREGSPNTIKNYKAMAEWINDQIGTQQIRSLTGVELDTLMDRIAEDKGKSSADHYYRFLRAALKQAVKWGLLHQEPTIHATAPAPPPSRGIAPSAATVRALIAKAESSKSDDIAAIIFVAATTGMRRGELCALRVSDVDFDLGELVVRRSISVVDGQTHVRGTKTNKARRIALDTGTVRVLAGAVAQLEHDRELAASDEGDPYIWTKEADHLEPKPPDTVTQAFNRIVGQLGLTDLHFHDLRHFAATQMLGGGIDVVTAAARLGHSPAMMLKTYAQVIPARDRDAATMLGGVLSA